ncbi:hypothetical protein [Gellertiella hungarica]|uniref:Uncharacterized protein n=1 Tax=Gellertiella hungarica TaxID=1572859 RepID=A0A7W6J6I0_9HYPH|nr:hypothetical protein [Gellertiella hungarica]MBB4065696.1 hypothetical protein [Gellertiella hungarica]
MNKASDFERQMQERFSITPVKTRLLLRIAEGLTEDLRNALRGSTVARDMDALLVLTRLCAKDQQRLAKVAGRLLSSEEAVQLVAKGQIQPVLDYCTSAQWLDR